MLRLGAVSRRVPHLQEMKCHTEAVHIKSVCIHIGVCPDDGFSDCAVVQFLASEKGTDITRQELSRVNMGLDGNASGKHCSVM